MDLSDYKEIGESGHPGIVYLENETTGHQLVLKRTSIERGLNEIKAYKKLENTPLLSYRMEKNGVLLMMMRFPGESLRNWTSSQDKRKRSELSQNLGKVLESAMVTLRKIHDRGLAHGHITPDRIMISEDYHVRFIGFGDSRAERNRKPSRPFDVFDAPEIVFSSDADLFLADYYSLGKSLQTAYDDQVIDLDCIDRISRLMSVIPEHRK